MKKYVTIALFSLVCATFLLVLTTNSFAKPVFTDTTRTFAVPTLTRTPSGSVALSWTEKDQQGTIYFYWAESTDNGATFGAKKLIFASPGIGSSRLMRPKLLFRKGGQPVAVFALQGPEVAKAAMNSQADAGHRHAGHHNHGAAASETKPAQQANRGGRASDLQIVYCASNDGGTTWSIPTPVHQDKTAQMVRGFFDAIVLANGEVGVAYLNDIPGKPHERDLRFVTTANGKFGPEKVLDPFVCDCCNISLLVDASGTLRMYYRENQDNIRDIAHLSSTDNGQTFTKASILSPDNWKVNGCPHSGPTSAIGAGTNLIAWFSGTTDAPGIRVANQQGKRLFVIDNPTAKNAWLAPAPNAAVLVWEQSQVAESGTSSVIAYQTIRSDKPSTTQFVKKAINATNSTGLVNQGKLLVAYEVRNPNNRNSIEVAQADL
ncbi:hypothetical protein GCM10023189_35580 [Nibrella saemangeumensis]|uniref:Sialidase domain-containing protein n=1 Tax=Nibrella saemangeumensis TaxID=1084526 RepID=A0ABP8N5N1_9BACT